MLPKAHRLTSRQFDETWKRGTSACGAFVCVRVMGDAPDFRAAAIAPKKSAPTAPKRNRLRRVLYGALRTALFGADSVSEHIIVSPKTPLANVSGDDLARDIKRTAEKARQRATKTKQ